MATIGHARRLASNMLGIAPTPPRDYALAALWWARERRRGSNAEVAYNAYMYERATGRTDLADRLLRACTRILVHIP